MLEPEHQGARKKLAAAMHFTFIALTPVIDVDFLSYQYEFFSMQMECWWKSSADGTGRGKGSPHRPSTANPWVL